MKRLNTSFTNIIYTLILSFAVMEYINLLVGRVGGVPVMVGFFVAYMLMRYRIIPRGQQDGAVQGSSTDISGTDRSSIYGSYRILAVVRMAQYIGTYVAVWLAGTVILFMSKFYGWGNVKKLSFTEYFKSLYGSTLSDLWEYIFAIILMLTVIMSLFPLNIIKSRKTYVRYLLGDGVIWTIILMILGFVNKKLIDHKVMWQAGCLMTAAVILLILETVLVYRLVTRKYRHEQTGGKLTLSDMRRHRKNIRIAIVSVVIVSVMLICAVTYFMSPSDGQAEYEKVAECLTQDSVMGPMVYDGQVYIPISLGMDYDETGKALGYIVYKDQDYSSRYYEIAASNLLYMNKNGDDTYLQMAGNDSNSYKKLSVLEKTNSWKDDNVFLMWDEEWESESKYSKDVTGFTECDKDFIQNLESTFGEVEIEPKDFEDYDAYFTIAGYKSMKAAVESDEHIGTWVGCILVKDDRFYYGNYDNEITGGLLQKLRHVLGGN